MMHEAFHLNKKLQKRIIEDNNFTYRELIRILKPYLKNCDTILDIGCGVGTIDFYLAAKGKKVTGVEISASAVSLAKENARLFNLNKKVRFITAEFPGNLPIKKYDLVIFSEVIEHLQDDKRALRDVWKVLNPNGILVITTPSKNAPLYKMGLLDTFDKSVGHLRRYTIEGLINLVKSNEYEIIDFGKNEGILRNFLFTNSIASRVLRFIRWKISDLVTFIDNVTISLFGESDLWIVARKI